MTHRTLSRTIRLTLALAAVLTGSAPLTTLSAQIPTRKPLGILQPQDFPPTDEDLLFSSRLATEQGFSSMTDHPQTYRLDLGGRPMKQISIGGQIAYGSSGLHRDLYTQIDFGVLIPITHRWFFAGGIDGGFNHRHYRLDGIVTEHPAYQEALADDRASFVIGTDLGAIYRRDDIGCIAFGSQAHLTADGEDIATVSYLRYSSIDDGLRQTVFHPYFVHTFYSRERTRHYYKVGLRTDLFRDRFFVEAAYETSKDVQTFAAAIGITLYKGLRLHYALDLPFRFDGRHAGTAAHTVAISYDLRRKPFQQPRRAGKR